MSNETILVGDAGGTNVRFAVARIDDSGITLSPIWKRPGAGYPTFAYALSAYLAESGAKPTGASFGLAGAEVDGRIELLNRGWTVDRRETTEQLGLDSVVMVNDFFAMARGAVELAPGDALEITSGVVDSLGSVAVGGPGTGFGIAMLRRVREGWVVGAGEGGHQSYSPQTDVEWRLAENLRAHAIYPSNEIVAAGIGFDQTRRALAEVMGVADRQQSQQDVIDAAQQGEAFALEFCRLRARCVMTTIGDLSLVANSTGGVFLAGGVTQRLIPWLKEKAALDCFYQRGPRTALLARFPIRNITSEAAPLIGAAHLWRDERDRGWL
jgi:glucokinase